MTILHVRPVGDGRGREAGDETILGRLRRLRSKLRNVSCVPWTRGRNCGVRRIPFNSLLSRAPIGLRKTGLAEHDENCGTHTANKGFDIDEAKSRIVEPDIAVAAIGADLKLGRATP